MTNEPIGRESVAEDASRFRVTSRREVAAVLTELGETCTMLAMTPAGGDPVITTVVEVNPQSGTLLVDWARSTHLTRTLRGKRLAFEAQLHKIRITFSVESAEECVFEGAAALRLPFPTNLVRLQRRDHFRCTVPHRPQALCRIPVPGVGVVSLPVRDISAGGVALVDPNASCDLPPGALFEECELYLGDDRVVPTGIEIRNVTDIPAAGGRTTRRLGCMFVDLSTIAARFIQRYVNNLQRDALQRQSAR